MPLYKRDFFPLLFTISRFVIAKIPENAEREREREFLSIFSILVKSERASSDLFPIVASGGPPPRATSFTPFGGRFSPPTLGFIDPLYIYLLCRGPLCDGRHEWKGPRRWCTSADLSPSPSLSLPWLYLTSIIKINRPISYVKYYPRARLNILSLSTLPPTLPSFFPPAYPRGRGGQKAAEGNRSRERHAIRFCFVACSSSRLSLGISSFRTPRGWGSNIVAVDMRSFCHSCHIFSSYELKFPNLNLTFPS